MRWERARALTSARRASIAAADAGGGLVQRLSRRPSLLLVEAAEPTLERAELRALADEVVLDAGKVVDVIQRGEPRDRGALSLLDLVDHGSQVKQRASVDRR